MKLYVLYYLDFDDKWFEILGIFSTSEDAQRAKENVPSDIYWNFDEKYLHISGSNELGVWYFT